MRAYYYLEIMSCIFLKNIVSISRNCRVEFNVNFIIFWGGVQCSFLCLFFLEFYFLAV